MSDTTKSYGRGVTYWRPYFSGDLKQRLGLHSLVTIISRITQIANGASYDSFRHLLSLFKRT